MLREYQKEATATFKTHEPLSPHQARLLDWALGLGGESGEVEELIKHHVFSGEPLNKMELAKELGDVLWYLSAIAATAGFTLQDVAELNLEKLRHRYHQGKYTDGASQDRKGREQLFTETFIYKVIQERILAKKYPNVFFIGPDGSGKTTLSKAVAEQLGWKYHKCDYRQPDKAKLAKALLESQQQVIYDRFYYPDDIVYCSAKGLEISVEDLHEYERIAEILSQERTLYIYVTCDKDELIKRSSQWKDDYVRIDELDQIIHQYNLWQIDAIEKYGLSVFTLDTTHIELGTEEHQKQIDACCDVITQLIK